MRRVLMALIALTIATGVMAQVGTAVKETGRATVEAAKSAGDQLKGAVSSEPRKSSDKAKAKLHKVKARHHAHVAKEAAKEAGKGGRDGTTSPPDWARVAVTAKETRTGPSDRHTSAAPHYPTCDVTFGRGSRESRACSTVRSSHLGAQTERRPCPYIPR